MIPYPHIRPEIVTIGPLSVRWYGLMYVIGFTIAWQMIKQRARRGLLRLPYAACESFVTYMIISMLLGARLVYAFVYNWDVYSQDLLQIFRIWEGGLSFHGAALGMCIGCVVFARRYKVPAYSVIDTLAWCAGPGIFFGRIGNFINGELYGRPTDVPWAMVFPTDPEKLPRHPSQIYQGLTEGLLVFALLWLFQSWLLKKGQYRHGLVGVAFGLFYGTFRFLVEFAREPDKQLGFVFAFFSMGQLLCLLFAAIALVVLWHVLRTQPVIDPRPQTTAELEGATESAPPTRGGGKKRRS